MRAQWTYAYNLAYTFHDIVIRQMKIAAFWTLALSMAVLISIFVTEVALRAIGLGSPIIYASNLTYRYAPVANQVITRRREATVTINSAGLRAIEEWDARADMRILFFGDSVTWGGTYIDDSDTFSEMSCGHLNEYGEIKFICGNAGVNAYGTDNMAQRIRHDSIDNENWIVITLVGLDSIRSLQNVTAGPWFLESPRYLPAIQDAAHYSLWRVIDLLRGTGPEKHRDTSAVASLSLQRLKEVLGEEASKGKRVLVIWHPTRPELESGALSVQSRLVFQIFRDDPDSDFVDMSTALRRFDLDDVYYDSVHLDMEGHRIFARLISDHIAATLQLKQSVESSSR